MTNLKTIIMCLLVAISVNVFSQNQWYFGQGAGIDFTNANPTNPPTAIPVGVNLMQGQEGSAMGYDENGNIKFYTDGNSIFFPQNSGIGNLINVLESSTSSTHAVTIIPINCNQFLIFTLQTFTTPEDSRLPNFGTVNNGLKVSRLDINGTTASLVFRNLSINNTNTPIVFSEKLANYRIPGTDDYWIVAHNYLYSPTQTGTNNTPTTNTFYSYRIRLTDYLTNNPIMPTPFISNLGLSHTGGFHMGVGQMKISPNGNMIAYINGLNMELFRFNPNNGEVSNRIGGDFYRDGYGVEFSNDNQFLFYSSFSQGIKRMNISTPTNTTNLVISSSGGNGCPFGALQMGPDNALYCARGCSGTQQFNSIIRIVNPSLSNYTSSQILVTGRAFIGLPTITRNVSCAQRNFCECNEGFTNIVVQDNIFPSRKGKRYDYKCGNKHDQNINEVFYLRPILSCNGTPTGTISRITYSIKNEVGTVIVEDRVLPQPTTSNGAIEVVGFNNFIKLSKDLFPTCGLYTISFKGSCCNDECNGCELKINVIGCEPTKDCITCCLPSTLKDINDNKLFLNQFRNPSLDYQPSENFKTLINNYLSTIRAEATENNCQLKEGDVDIKLNFYKYNGNANPNDINRTFIRTDFRAFQNSQNNNFQLISTHSATANTNFENLLTLNGWYIVELSIKVKNKPDCSTSLIVIKDNNLGKRNTSTNSNKN